MSPAQRRPNSRNARSRRLTRFGELKVLLVSVQSRLRAMKCCAADVVYGATRLLEGLLDREDDDRRRRTTSGGRRSHCALGNWDEMEAGISHAIRLQQATRAKGASRWLLLRTFARLGAYGAFRLDHGSPADVKLFTHPLSLLKLALFIKTDRRVTRRRLRCRSSSSGPLRTMIPSVDRRRHSQAKQRRRRGR